MARSEIQALAGTRQDFPRRKIKIQPFQVSFISTVAHQLLVRRMLLVLAEDWLAQTGAVPHIDGVVWVRKNYPL
jgi:hypothetical protein